MAYSTSILPRSAAYYTLSNADITNSQLNLGIDGYAEIQVSKQMLAKLTSKMLIVVHPSEFSDSYSNDSIQVTLSIITSEGSCLEFLLPVTYDASGVFNTEIELPEEDYVLFTYRISSKKPVTVYNWELCAEEDMNVSTIINGIEQELPKLLYDYNTYAYAVGQKEHTVGIITCYLLNATDLQGHFTISFFATERCNVHVRIKDNGITELFSPQVYTVEQGYASVSVPHAYLKKLATDHAFSVTLQCSNGQLSVPVRGMLYTIDGGYLATRLLDAGIDVQDISIKQLKEDTSPSEIWAIGFEGNRLVLKKRDYDYAQDVNWVAVKDFGEGRLARVEFRGSWINRNNSAKYTMETENNPYVFVLENDGRLVVYSGETYDNVFELDTGVTDAHACQGFNSMYYIEQDQGLVVAYIKNGNTYYRQYMYNDSIDDLMWYPATLIYSGSSHFVSVHRLPDYRLGICVEHGTGTKWFITDRTYVSQAVKTEVIDRNIAAAHITTVFEADNADGHGEATLNNFEDEPEALAFNGFVVTYSGPVVFLEDHDINDLLYATKIFINNVQQEDAIDKLTVTGNAITVTLKSDVAGGSSLRILFDFFHMAVKIYNDCLCKPSLSHTWDLPLPTQRFNVIEPINVGINATTTTVVKPLVEHTLECTEVLQQDISATLNLQVSEIITTTKRVIDDIDVSISPSVTLVATQTGTTPI